MDRSAFSRAWDYVGYAPTAKWLAVFGAAASGASFVLLIMLLGLFADLMIGRGEIPTYGDLSASKRLVFQNRWNSLPVEARSEALSQVPIDESARKQLVSDFDIDTAPFANLATRWKAHVGQMLDRRVGPDAANEYRVRTVPSGRSETADPDHVQLGVLGLIVRNDDSLASRVIGWIARWNPWMWKPSRSGRPNEPYLFGLLICAVVVAVFRALFVNLMHHSAAVATLEAVTRLRRLLYHHTYRLGSLTISSDGPRGGRIVHARG